MKVKLHIIVVICVWGCEKLKIRPVVRLLMLRLWRGTKANMLTRYMVNVVMVG